MLARVFAEGTGELRVESKLLQPVQPSSTSGCISEHSPARCEDHASLCTTGACCIRMYRATATRTVPQIQNLHASIRPTRDKYYIHARLSDRCPVRAHAASATRPVRRYSAPAVPAEHGAMITHQADSERKASCRRTWYAGSSSNRSVTSMSVLISAISASARRSEAASTIGAAR